MIWHALLLLASPQLADLSAEKRSLVEALQSARTEISDRGIDDSHFAWRFHDDQAVRFLGGEDLAPGCVPAVLTTTSAGKTVLDCMLTNLGELFSADGADVELTSFVVETLRTELGGETIIKAGQRLDGLPVKDAKAIVVVWNGGVAQYTGHLFSSAQLPRTAGPRFTSADDARAAAESVLGMPLAEVVGRYYDRLRGTVVTEVRLPESSEVLLFDEASWTVIAIENRVAHAPLPHTSLVWSYDNTWTFVVPTCESRTMLMEHTGSTNGSGSCTVKLDRGTALTKAKTVYDSDGDGNESSAFSYNHSGSACASGTEVMWSVCDPTDGDPRRFVNLHFYADDLSYFVGQDDTGYTFWYGFDAASQDKTLKIVASKLGSGDDPCDGSTACTALFGTEYRIVFEGAEANNLYSLAHEYGHYLHYMYGFNMGGSESAAIAEGFADHNVLRYAMFRFRGDSTRLWDQFGPVPNDPNIPDLDELYYSAPYVDGRIHFQHRQVPMMGAVVPSPGSPDWSQDAINGLVYNPAIFPCDGLEDQTNYSCGQLLPLVYWELATNRMRVKYNGYSIDTKIHDSGDGWSLEPEKAANLAFTYAINTIPANSDLEDFFNAVSARYNMWYTAVPQQMTAGDYNRVHAVLNHHCVGWSNHCFDNYHRFASTRRTCAAVGDCFLGAPPGEECCVSTERCAPQDLGICVSVNRHPSAFTYKANFADAQTPLLAGTEHFINSEAFVPVTPGNGSFHVASHPTTDTATYIHLLTGDAGEVYFNVPETGFYRVAAIARRSGGNDSFRTVIDGVQCAFHFGYAPDNSWTRVEGKPVGYPFAAPVYNLTAGSHYLVIKPREVVDVDAVVIISSSAVNSPCVNN